MIDYVVILIAVVVMIFFTTLNVLVEKFTEKQLDHSAHGRLQDPFDNE